MYVFSDTHFARDLKISQYPRATLLMDSSRLVNVHLERHQIILWVQKRLEMTVHDTKKIPEPVVYFSTVLEPIPVSYL